MACHLVLCEAHASQGGIDGVLRHWSVHRTERREHKAAIFCVMLHSGDESQCLPREGNGVDAAHLGLVCRDGPQCPVEIEVGPFGVAELTGAHEHMRQQSKGRPGTRMSLERFDSAQQDANPRLNW